MTAFAPILKPATPAQVAQRSYTVAHVPQADWSLRRGMDWTLRKYGQGACTVCAGEPSYFPTEARAHEVGQSWLATGRAA